MIRYPKKYSMKEWNRFKPFMQELLCRKYDIILTDHRTKKEKLNDLLNKFNKKNLDRAIDTFQGMANSMDKAFKEWDKMKNKSMVGHQKDLSVLTGSKKKTDYTALTGKSKGKDYSALLGKRKEMKMI